MDKSEVTYIALTMIVSASLTVAVEYWPAIRAKQTSPVSQTSPAPFNSAPGPSAKPAPLEVRSPPAVIANPAPERNAAPAPESGTSAEEAQPAEALPVTFHVRNRRDANAIEGTISNIGSKPLSITLRVLRSGSETGSEMSFALAPGEQKNYSSENLYLQSNDQIVVHSPPYQDRMIQVP